MTTQALLPPPDVHVRSCPFCGRDDGRWLKYGTEHSRLLQCRDCGVVYWSQPWSTGHLSHYYHGYYDPATITYDPITEARYHALLDRITRVRPIGRLLDVGCGAGHFLTVAEARGWRTYGLEISEAALQFLTALRTQRGLHFELVDRHLAEANFGPNSFDVVTMFEVIEHVDEPVSILTEVHRILQEGGLLYLTTPNYNSLSRYLLGNRWRVIAEEHRCLVTVQALRRSLMSRGFHILAMKTKNIDPAELLTTWGRHQRTPASPRRRDSAQRLRHTVERTRWLRFMKQAANAWLRIAGLGDTVEVLAIKRAEPHR